MRLSRLIAIVCLALCLVAGPPSAARAAALPAPVAHVLAQAGIDPEEAVALWVQPLDAPHPRLVLNAARPMNPASVMKLVTAFAAFAQLGPAHTWHTRVAYTGLVRDGVLYGDLFLIGAGDPLLDAAHLATLLRQVRALGITAVRGAIVLDPSALRLPPHDPAAFDGQPLRPYNSPGWGLLLAASSVRLTLLPSAPAGAPVALAAEPPLAGLTVDNRLVSAAGPCEPWQRALAARLERDAAGTRLILDGSVPASCGQREWTAAPLAPPEFAVALVTALWQEVGGAPGKGVRVDAAPATAAPLLIHTSPPLAEVVREMNKWSHNVIARQLLATLGAHAAPESADMVAAGAQAALAALATAGIETHGLRIDNGAGLSRTERVRADTLGQLLRAAWGQPWMPEFIAALPLAGVDGTARRRLAASPARGQAHIKTGTLDGVRALAGYVLDRHGRRHAVVMLVNHPQAAASLAAQDALLEWVWAGCGTQGGC